MDYTAVVELEKKLLEPSVRKNTNELDVLLADEFMEFGTSGHIYEKKIILARMPRETHSLIEAFDFEAVKLASDVVHLRFKAKKVQGDGSSSVSLRSSIWKCTGGRWQIVFHQGTKAAHL